LATAGEPDYQAAFEVGKSALADIVLHPMKQTVPGLSIPNAV
jgi:hypothetical protein